MLVSLNWLRDYVEIDIPVKDLAEKLSMAGLEVEAITEFGQTLCNIVTAKIESIAPHPDADRLVVTQLSDGTTTHQIVTNATNISVGDVIPISLPGAVLHSGLVIKPTVMRGVDSNGMLCSEVELGVADTSSGIWILPKDTPLGVDFVAYAGLCDTIFDIGILPNRGDCLSVIGIARDISALLDVPLKNPSPSVKTTPSKDTLTVTVITADLCPFYSGWLIKDAVVAPSPLWMQRRLSVSGISPINNIVDITNYVLLEYGQPLHAFDYANISDGKLHIRMATADEKLTTLDSKDLTLTADNLIIADDNGPLALAGVMGGKSSEVTTATTAIVLEAGLFDATSVRKTANKFTCRTDSAIRFEKRVDAQSVTVAATRAAEFMHALAGATITTVKTETKNADHPYFSSLTIPFSTTKLNDLLGSNLTEKEIITPLTRLGFNCTPTAVNVPSWRRNDVTTLPCLTEEISRLIGLNNLPSKRAAIPAIAYKADALYALTAPAEDYLVGQGFNQVVTYPMVGKEACDNCLFDTDLVAIKNPISQNAAYMRPSLLPSLMEILVHNQNRQVEHVRLFEIGKIFGQADPVKESTLIAGLGTGNLMGNHYTKAPLESSFFYAKGIVTNVLNLLGVMDPVSLDTIYPSLHPKQQIGFSIQGIPVGFVGMVHPQILATYNCAKPVAYFEIDATALTTLTKKPLQYHSFSTQPFTKRDMAILAPKTLAYKTLSDALTKLLPKRATGFYRFDQFESEKIGIDNISYGIAVTYQHPSKSLEDDAVNRMHEGFCKQLKNALPPISFR